MPSVTKRRVSTRKIRREALKSFQAVLAAETEIQTTLFTYEMHQHPELVKAWEDDELPRLVEALDKRSLDGQKQAMREGLMRMAREREMATQFLFNVDQPHDWLARLRDDDDREVLIKHLYRSKYRLGGVADYARAWGRMAIMDDAGIYVMRDIGATLFKDSKPDDWFEYYVDAVARMVFHGHEAALAAERGREYEFARLVRAYEKLVDGAENSIRRLEGFSYSRLEFERDALAKKGRRMPGLQGEEDTGFSGRPSVYLGS